MNDIEIIEKFLKAKRVKLSCILGSAISLPIFIIITVLLDIKYGGNVVAICFYIYTIIIGVSLFVVWKYWRCPKCNHSFPREVDFKFCPYCGAKVQYGR